MSVKSLTLPKKSFILIHKKGSSPHGEGNSTRQKKSVFSSVSRKDEMTRLSVTDRESFYFYEKKKGDKKE